MNKHTPGPWMVEGPWIGTGDGTGIGIAKIARNIGQPAKANARLIAAAPDLLEYLAVAIYWSELGKPMTPTELVNARTAIAKAADK